ncbi:M20 family metallo-hydrolase [Neobacillus niacini]|uniref:M20 family metallo-hydrolase n=1 Tax=Neobacillus niacini TaxID=86668 RepID=UPI0020418C8B|nr:M20 family metallo-hydrolase [Neobacillus niacini]MCM3693758.1 M20 family metallo-hydrolase [Neobacillus niacini]
MGQYPIKIDEAIEWLASFGGEQDGGVTRTLYSQPWKEAQQALKGWMEEVGLLTNYDSIGNLFGRLPSPHHNAKTILIGSHVDTVKSGGKYDGAYGIIAGVLALKYLKKQFGQPAIHLEVVSFCEEEGSRFPLALWGSGMMTGLYSFNDSVDMKDSEGISFETAMMAAGFGNSEYRVRKDIQTFIELHIEQGPTLEKVEKSIGIVKAIVGQKRYRVTVKGESNHVGTTSMKWRRDALHGAVNMIHDLYESVKEYDEDLVTSVGQLFVEPNVPNVIPNQVQFTVDARHPNESVLDSFCQQFTQMFQEHAKKLDLDIEVEMWHEVHPAQMDSGLNEIIQSICTRSTISSHWMNSGAGHDAQLFAQVCPTTILFVPSQGGISHSPLEYTSPKDLETGLEVLIQLLHQLAY